MKEINKGRILSILRENYEIKEMARELSKDWPVIELFDIQVHDVSNMKTLLDGPIECVNPNLDDEHEDFGKKFKNIIFPKRLRVSPNGTVAAEFLNQADGKKENNFFILEGPNVESFSRRLLKFKPRSRAAGTEYKGPSCSLEDESQAKRYWLYPTINNFFSRMDVSAKLNSLGLPTVTAGSKFTEPITNVQRIMRYGGPEICFELNSNVDFEDVTDALNRIVSYRESEARGETPEVFMTKGTKNQVRKYGGQIYKGGKWVQAQRVLSADYFEKTPILKLFMKAVQEGKIQYSVMSEFEVMGELNGTSSSYELYLEFRFFRTYRNPSNVIAMPNVKKLKPERVLPPLKVNITKPIPQGVDVETLTYKKNSNFFNQILREGLELMSQKIFEIDPSDVLPQIDASFFDIENFDFE